MNAERHQQVKQIFLAACELEPRRAAAFLDQACAGDQEVREEVESLLLHHFSATIIGKSPYDTKYGKTLSPLLPDAANIYSEAMLGTPDSIPKTERFPPGTILAGRYRIIAPLGRGGMGDVYRADDLKLDQTVALKFLSHSRSESPAWIRRYQNEVRLARKVTHPNVVRVYDISEAEGEVFISMEYVDGEDLATLLRRIGRLTSDKAIQVARQLCAGLGAAHDQGVLHRDLKPANIMIDGRGQVRIADFGIAALVSQAEDSSRPAGTPAFMAPELFDGGRPTIRGDLYSLGVVLYEAVTGKEPFDGVSPGLQAHNITAIRPTAFLPEIDAVLESVILQCLERDYKRRPDSAYAVAAALPGGDPLALALAAGETPSPSMIAAAGAWGALNPIVAVGCLVVGLAALFVVVRLADRTFFLPQAGLEKSPIVLADKAEDFIAILGRKPNASQHWQGFAIDRGYLEYAATTENRLGVLKNLSSGRPPAVCFWYRTGSEQIAIPALLGEPLPAQVFPKEPGIVTIRLDGRGRLLQYLAMPERTAFPDAGSRPADWAVTFELAGLPITQFRPIRTVREPPIYADSVATWEGAYPGDPELPIRVEGASLGGKVVYFDVVPPWDQNWSDVDEGPSRAPRGMPAVRLGLYLLAAIVGGFLALHNIRRGRGDQRGACKLIVFVLLLGLLDWLLGERHVAAFTEEVAMFYLWLARATLTAAIAGVAYFAVEPYVRRYWPHIMITWSRVLGGKLRDPLVGRDILVGGMCGILFALVVQIDYLLPSWLGLPSPLPKLPKDLYDLGALLGLRYKLGILVTALLTSITLTLVALLLMLVVRVALRPPWLAMAVAWLLLTALQRAATGYDVSFPWLTSSILTAIAIALLVRVGLVALIANLFFWHLIINSPITSNFRVWFAPSSTFTIIFAAALLVCGFLAARAGRPLFWHRLLEN
jgi:eukaryotic-like serine/threonine-protein kinase